MEGDGDWEGAGKGLREERRGEVNPRACHKDTRARIERFPLAKTIKYTNEL